MLVHAKTILQNARVKKFAVGAFSTTNLEMTLGIVRAAVAEKSPVVVQISEEAIAYAGLTALANLVKNVAQGEGEAVPIALHLEHGRSFASVSAAVAAGFSSIMINQAELPFEENVLLTKKSVDFAHKHDVWAQGQLGVIPGGEGQHRIALAQGQTTGPQEAKDFVKQTQVDGLSVSFGNIRGVDKLNHKPDLDFGLLQAIKKEVDVPLVLQGSSLMPDETLNQCIDNGIDIVSFNTDMRLAFAQALRTVTDQKNAVDTRAIMHPAIQAVADTVAQKLKVLGSAQKA